MKRPAFQFYPADWAKDLALRSCSLAAQGLWMQMLCVAHESEQYGFLMLNGEPLTDAQIVAMIPQATRRLLAELEAAKVFSRDGFGAIYSRRMARDEALREVRAACGKLGGNPVLVGSLLNQNSTTKVNQKPTTKDKVFPTPSSSSSSSKSAFTGVKTPTVPSAREENTTSQVKDANVKNAFENIENQPQKNANGGQKWDSPEWVNATAAAVGKRQAPGEPFPDFRDRVYGAVQAKFAEAKRTVR